MNTCRMTILAAAIFLAGCNATNVPVKPAEPPAPKPADAQENPAASAAESIINALKSRNSQALDSYEHPEKGVRFSPYTTIRETDIVFRGTDFAGLYASDDTRIWGSYDGSGEPIVLTPAEYVEKFVWDHDYSQAPEVLWNEPKQRGNAMNTIAEFYPGASIVEYHFPGFDPQYGGMDWASLLLVFEGDRLVGIVHDQWTI